MWECMRFKDGISILCVPVFLLVQVVGNLVVSNCCWPKIITPVDLATYVPELKSNLPHTRVLRRSLQRVAGPISAPERLGNTAPKKRLSGRGDPVSDLTGLSIKPKTSNADYGAF